ncbi:peptide chain release factor 2 [Candidatus Wolfebacteria bacterium]|nr:MAG: peptide chain release factor 2 [Candidatus Wolfebacteria bacterium]
MKEEKTPSEEIKDIEKTMTDPHFWEDKVRAQEYMKRLNDLKQEIAGKKGYDAGNAVMTIFAGAGGDDAEDFSRILFEMYNKYIDKQGWSASLIHKNENTQGGFRNITIEITGKGVYGKLKNESGVHRLVRISPFNANKKRHTSFSMVEVIPQLPKTGAVELRSEDLNIELSKSGGPGGQNVNKRETAVRIVHIPTNISVHADSERSQMQNKDKAMEILRGKIYTFEEEQRKKEKKGLSISSTTQIEWGSQIRSYVTHPYKMVKDHRTDVEVHDVTRIFDGDLEEFITAEKNLVE